MGRHEKTSSAKKEKIYALRKKLDVFIEEDKKRRDRNVYILERFEKMRSTLAILKSINNNIVIENDNSANHLLTKRSNDRVFLQQDVLNYRENHVDEGKILKEISKKYILIPRIYSMNRYPVIDIKPSDDVDWRSKYNILDELKKKEREEPPERDRKKNFTQNDKTLQNNNHFSSNNNDIETLPQDKERRNIPLSNKSIPSYFNDRGKPYTSSIINSNDWRANSISDKCSNVQNENMPLHVKKYLDLTSNIKNENKCMKDDQYDTSIKAEKTNNPNKNQHIYTKKFKDQEMSINNYDENVVNEIQCEKESIYSDTQDLPSKNLPEVAINETEVKCETKHRESSYAENISKHVDTDEAHRDVTSNNMPQLATNVIELGKYVAKQEVFQTENINPDQDTNKAHLDVSSNNLQKVAINNSELSEYETKPQQFFQTENFNQNVETNEGHQDEIPETYYENEVTNANDPYNNYYEDQPQQPHQEMYDNVTQENQETVGNYTGNYVQEHEDAQKSQFIEDYRSQNNENYETHNKYTTENQIIYQNVDKQNPENDNSNNNLLSESLENFNDNQQYDMHQNEQLAYNEQQAYGEQQQDYGEQQQDYGEQQQAHGEQQQAYGEQQQDYGEQQQDYGEQQQAHGEQQQAYGEQQQDYGEQQQDYGEQQQAYGQEQQAYDQQNYVDPTLNQNQQPYLGNKEDFLENNITKNIQDNIPNQEDLYNLQPEYNTELHGETERQFDGDNYSNIQIENHNLQQDYNNQHFNELYNDNQGTQDVPHEYSAQSQETLQHNGLGYNEQVNQGEFIHYDHENGLNTQNEFSNLPEDYGDGNIHQEENSQVQDIQDNVQYDYTPQSNEIQHNDLNTAGSYENH